MGPRGGPISAHTPSGLGRRWPLLRALDLLFWGGVAACSVVESFRTVCALQPFRNPRKRDFRLRSRAAARCAPATLAPPPPSPNFRMHSRHYHSSPLPPPPPRAVYKQPRLAAGSAARSGGRRERAAAGLLRNVTPPPPPVSARKP